MVIHLRADIPGEHVSADDLAYLSEQLRILLHRLYGTIEPPPAVTATLGEDDGFTEALDRVREDGLPKVLPRRE